jgi:hypothetical protein
MEKKTRVDVDTGPSSSRHVIWGANRANMPLIPRTITEHHSESPRSQQNIGEADKLAIMRYFTASLSRQRLKLYIPPQ